MIKFYHGKFWVQVYFYEYITLNYTILNKLTKLNFAEEKYYLLNNLNSSFIPEMCRAH